MVVVVSFAVVVVVIVSLTVTVTGPVSMLPVAIGFLTTWDRTGSSGRTVPNGAPGRLVRIGMIMREVRGAGSDVVVADSDVVVAGPVAVVVGSTDAVVDSTDVAVGSDAVVVDSTDAVVDSTDVVVGSTDAVVGSTDAVVDSTDVVVGSDAVVVGSDAVVVGLLTEVVVDEVAGGGLNTIVVVRPPSSEVAGRVMVMSVVGFPSVTVTVPGVFDDCAVVEETTGDGVGTTVMMFVTVAVGPTVTVTGPLAVLLVLGDAAEDVVPEDPNILPATLGSKQPTCTPAVVFIGKAKHWVFALQSVKEKDPEVPH